MKDFKVDDDCDTILQTSVARQVEEEEEQQQQMKEEKVVVVQGTTVTLQLPEELPNDFPYIPIGHPDTMMSITSVQKAIHEFIIHPTDIIVTTFPKTGTTLITWICHLLRYYYCYHRQYNNMNDNNNNHYTDTNNNNNYYPTNTEFLHHLQSLETFYQVVPWPTLSWDIGYNPNDSIVVTCNSNYDIENADTSSGTVTSTTMKSTDSTTITNDSTDNCSKVNNNNNNNIITLQPRIYKEHLCMSSIYRGCKYIVTIRNPITTIISFYNFLLSKNVIDIQSMDISTFVLQTSFIKGRIGRSNLWEYYSEYHQLRNCSSVLIIIYENLVTNMSQTIKQIAQFMNLTTSMSSSSCSSSTNNITDTIGTIDNQLVEEVRKRSTKEYMIQYNTLFDEPYERAKLLNRVGDLSQLQPGPKVSQKQDYHDCQQQNQSQQQQQQQPELLFSKEALDFIQNEWNRIIKPLGYDTYTDFANSFI